MFYPFPQSLPFIDDFQYLGGCVDGGFYFAVERYDIVPADHLLVE